MEAFNAFLDTINGVIWHDFVLYIVLAVGVLFTIWSGFSQYRALTHGVAVTRGKYDDKDDPGAINHFQALSTALSATVGLGNIGGVALAIALGGPGAVFWMWVIGVVGMALKTTEVTLSMLYRNTDDPDRPLGGPMWVAKEGFKRMGLAPLGTLIGGIFCVTLLISTITGGNMFQAWNVAEITHGYFPTIPTYVIGVILAIIVGLVIIGGIKRIGSVTGRLVPLMCALYLLAALYVIVLNLGSVPEMLRLIVVSAFSTADASDAFLGGTAGYAFLWGMKRALFSSEAGQGSAPIAHSAAKTDEPVREGVVAGLEPFIDTIVVCTLTTLVILLSGAWNRPAEAAFDSAPALVNPQRIVYDDNGRSRTYFGEVVAETEAEYTFLIGNPGVGEAPVRALPRSAVTTLETATDRWVPSVSHVPAKSVAARRISGEWRANNTVFMIVQGETDANTGRNLHRLHGTLRELDDGRLAIGWIPHRAETSPSIDDAGLYNHFVGAMLTGHAFDRVLPGLGMWLVTIACWLFAISTMIAWSYYGEQGVIFLFGKKFVVPYKLVYCLLILIATLGLIRTDAELDNLTALGTGVMLWANIPIMLIFGVLAMRAYHDYFRRLKTGEMDPGHEAPPITDVVEGKDVE
ncbi:MAG: alanine:cation symporter family protein [Phycisphaerales bacterium]|nr:MAG: alanine:cation symporter family protein [Phycisphaerales bacterium]